MYKALIDILHKYDMFPLYGFYNKKINVIMDCSVKFMDVG